MAIGADEPGAPGRFDIRGSLGAGGMGVVYRAFDRVLGREVALKSLKHASGRDLYRFKREFRALADIVHPNLVVLHELHTAGDEWFFTMELVEGVPFIQWVRDQQVSFDPTVSLSGRTTPLRLLSVATARVEPAPHREIDHRLIEEAIAQLVDGVLALHGAGKLHRDLKPSNVLVTPEGRVVLLDFGLVSDVTQGRPADLTHDRAAVGTPAYMSPEQAADEPLDARSDWYSVGVMLYEALTGQRPFEGTAEEIMRRKQAELPVPPGRRAPGVPAVLDDLCMRLLSRRPADRLDGRAVLAALGRRPSRATVDIERSLAAGPFVGRAGELDTLRRAYADARKRGVAVFVCGESGIGKTQLVRRFLDEAIADGDALALEGRCYERESVPYKTLDTVIDAITGALLRLPDDELAEIVPRDVALLARR